MNKILILLSTYNGEKYLKEQLDSIFAQSYKDFEIIARDDGSNDETINILKSYNIKILDTDKNLGAKLSFSTLLDYSVTNTDADYFMFCDQDDIWKSDKIEKTIDTMKELEKENLDLPLLVHTDLEVVDEKLNLLAKSFWRYEKRDPSLNSINRLIIQSTVTGCTMMINRKLAEMSLPISENSIMHDWWISMVASTFGKISYLNESTISYRQHSSNDTGSKKFGLSLILKKAINFLFYDELYKHLDRNIKQAKSFLNQYESLLDTDTKNMLKDFVSIKEKSFLEKRKILLKHDILKQGMIRNMGLLLKI
jgi:glycosyltransferase involved in cell wall biosynthesis